MADRQDVDPESLSASVSVASETGATSLLVSQKADLPDKEFSQEVEIERRSWSLETFHKSEEEDDDGWMGTPLSTLTGRQHVRVSSKEMTEEDDSDVEGNVREALRLLEEFGDHEDGESEGEEKVEQWRTGQAKRDYLDFVHEIMEDRWTLGSRDGQFTRHWRVSEGHTDLEEKEMDEDVDVDVDDDRHEKHNRENKEQGEYKETDETVYNTRNEEGEEKGQEDEWQEAYTAKGRVYYYNRRTRESSWKKPSQFNVSSNQPPLAAAASDEESHSSVLRQSLGYHPSASVSTVSSMERQTTLFCCFCGKQQPSDQLDAHFRECATAKFHKRRSSPLYLSFERALALMSEDATLRSIHYASSFPDPTPHGRPGVTSMHDSLLLLRPKRRLSSTRKLSSTEDRPQKQPGTGDHVFGTSNGRPQNQREVDRSSAHHALNIEVAGRKKTDTIENNWQSTDSTIAAGTTETCQYCCRSFAEGRLAKHEAVCPRVFGHEGSSARGPPSKQISSPESKDARVRIPPRSTGSMTSSVQKLKDHTLQQNYKKHQATLVLCPCCRRKFAPSGAQQHIAICKGVQNRPKNPIPFLRHCAIVG